MWKNRYYFLNKAPKGYEIYIIIKCKKNDRVFARIYRRFIHINDNNNNNNQFIQRIHKSLQNVIKHEKSHSKIKYKNPLQINKT